MKCSIQHQADTGLLDRIGFFLLLGNTETIFFLLLTKLQELKKQICQSLKFETMSWILDWLSIILQRSLANGFKPEIGLSSSRQKHLLAENLIHPSKVNRHEPGGLMTRLAIIGLQSQRSRLCFPSKLPLQLPNRNGC